MLCSGGDPVVEISNITLHIDISGMDLLQKLRKGAPVPAPAAALAPSVGASRRLLKASESNTAALPADGYLWPLGAQQGSHEARQLLSNVPCNRSPGLLLGLLL